MVNRVTLIPRSLHIFASSVLSRPPEKATATDDSVSSDSATAVNRAPLILLDSNNYTANLLDIRMVNKFMTGMGVPIVYI